MEVSPEVEAEVRQMMVALGNIGLGHDTNLFLNALAGVTGAVIKVTTKDDPTKLAAALVDFATHMTLYAVEAKKDLTGSKH